MANLNFSVNGTSGEVWVSPECGVSVRDAYLIGRNQAVKGFVKVLRRDENDRIEQTALGEIFIRDTSETAAALMTIDPNGSLHSPLIELADQIRSNLITSHQGGQTSTDGGKKPRLTQASTVDPEEVSWLWYPLLPLGKLALLEGDPGAGKTWLALEIAKIISTGEPFPHFVPEMRSPDRLPGIVIYASAEDGVEDTLVPRLIAAGADCERVHFLDGWQRGEESGAVSLQDIDILRQAIMQLQPELVIIDPLQAFLGSGVDMNKANDVRGVLSPVVALAGEFKCTVLAIRHLTKGGRERAIYRGLGSIDFTAAARSQLLVGFDPENNERRIVAHAKSSLAPRSPSIAFRLEEGKFKWDGLSGLNAEDLCAPILADSKSEASAIAEAREFLRSLLADGPVEAGVVNQQAKRAGISVATLRRAKGDMSIQSHRLSDGNKGKGGWFWDLAGAEDAFMQGDQQGDNPGTHTMSIL